MNERQQLAYPPSLRAKEEALIQRRRQHDPRDKRPLTTTIGIAISGGGVRSATFALGVFQAFAASGFLRSVDYLSTVSGGGYFGGFLCGLFAPRKTTQPAAAPSPDWSTVERAIEDTSSELSYLRENGRYLAPAGSDDLWLAVAVLLRNWFAVQLALASAIALSFLALEIATHFVCEALKGAQATQLQAAHQAIRALVTWGATEGMIVSPWFLLVPIVAILGALPIGWSYWLAGTGALSKYVPSAPKVSTFAIAGIGCAVADWLILGGSQVEPKLVAPAGWILIWIMCVAFGAETVSFRAARDTRFRAQLSLLIAFAIATAFFGGAFFVALQLTELIGARTPGSAGALAGRAAAVAAFSMLGFGVVRVLVGLAYQGVVRSVQAKLYPDEPAATPQDEEHFARHSLSLWLMRIVIVVLVLLGLALIHSVARTLFAYASQGLGTFVGTVIAVLFGVQGFGRKAMTWLSNGSSTKRPPWFGTVAAYVAGVGLALAMLIALSGCVLWSIYRPCPAPNLAIDTGLVHCLAPLSEPNLGNVQLLGLILGVIALAFGSSHLFLNSSAQLPLYSARITRTFLGASNPRRTGEPAQPAPARSFAQRCMQPKPSQRASQKAATQLMPGDDIDAASYWSNETYDRGAPLHIINVTINETVDGRSRTQQADRKGLCLAVGPCGLSAGVRHHAVMRWNELKVCHTEQGDASVKVFAYGSDKPAEFKGEALTIGRWLGISGAAFSTGTGYRTNLGMSLLAGLANVRLGYWWRARVKRPITFWRGLGVVFWTQHYLRRELLARFPGTANTLWYLSDGGHFENTGAYELIRRQVPRIVLIDGGQDADYSLEDLGNLVRKARIDFGAEIEFLDHAEIGAHIGERARRYVGTLAELARGDWERVDALRIPPSEDDRAKQHRLGAADTHKRSLVHAALARVRYPGAAGHGLLLYIKPTLVGGEPADVVRYHAESPAFPHETTLDQFFGEPQWESYRALGHHIGQRLCGSAEGPFSKPV